MAQIKKTQVTELFCNIRATIVSFFSIMMFVALGVCLFLGIGWTGPALQTSVDTAYDEGSLFDISIVFPYGLTDDDLKQLEDVEGVSAVEGSRSAYYNAKVSGDSTLYTLKAMALTSDINALIQVEGTLPVRDAEIAVEKNWAHNHDVAVGDSITLDVDAGATEYLTNTKFKVTALVESPAYLSTQVSTYGVTSLGSGTINILAWVAPGAFNSETYRDGYTDVFVRCDSLRGLSTFSDEYETKVNDIKQRVEALGEQLGSARYHDIYQSASDTLADSRSQLDDAAKQIEDGEAQIADGEAQIASGEEQIASGEAQIASAEQQRASGVATLQALYQKLVSGEAQLSDARTAYDAAMQVLSSYEDKLAQFDTAVETAKGYVNDAYAYKADMDAKLAAGTITQEEYEDQVDEYCDGLIDKFNAYSSITGMELPYGLVTWENLQETLDSVNEQIDAREDQEITVAGQTMTVGEARQKLVDAKSEAASKKELIDSAAAQLAAGWAQYNSGKSQLDSATAQLEAGKQQLEAGKAEIAEKKQQLEDGKQQLEDGKAQLADGEAQYAAGVEKLNSLVEYGWTVTGRQYNGGVQSASILSAVTKNLRVTMASLFIIVGLLVCYSAVSRIVHEQITQVGTKKALGLRNREITLSYLAYSGAAVLVGAVIGVLGGVFAVEPILIGTLKTRFVVEAMPPYFSVGQMFAIVGVELALILAATWFACRSVLKRQAVELLAGEKPPSAKPRFFEKWALWQKLPLFTQTIVNNCLNDRRRVAGTVIGIAGCTALIVTAVSMNDNVLNSFTRQYDDVYSFNALAYCTSAVDEEADESGTVSATAKTDATAAALAAQGATSTPVYRSYYTLGLDDGNQDVVSVIVPLDEDAFSDFMHINPVHSGDATFGDDGVWLCAAYAEHLGVKVGDTVNISTSSGEIFSLSVAGFYKYYLPNKQMVMSPGLYEQVFGTAPASNALLANTWDCSLSVTELGEQLSGTSGFTALSNDYVGNQGNFNVFSSLSRIVVAVYLVLSVLMALVVLLNLNVMFVEEKKRELIVLMINGFSVKDAKAYIYRDTIVLTVIGIIFGLVLGAIMGYVTVVSIENGLATFVKDVDPVACAAGIGGSAVLAFAMSLIALRAIPRFNLTDINRF